MDTITRVRIKVKSQFGSRDNPYWVYGQVADRTLDKDGYTLHKIDWNDGGHNYLYSFEFEAI